LDIHAREEPRRMEYPVTERRSVGSLAQVESKQAWSWSGLSWASLSWAWADYHRLKVCCMRVCIRAPLSWT
jgi:hypothetical protein